MGRGAFDNAFVVLELYRPILTSDKRLNQGKPCLVIKLDLKKAYNRLNWEFLEATVRSFNFLVWFIRLVLDCISSTSIIVRYNGYNTTYFVPI